MRAFDACEVFFNLFDFLKRLLASSDDDRVSEQTLENSGTFPLAICGRGCREYAVTATRRKASPRLSVRKVMS
jgi:hypothetical protein